MVKTETKSVPSLFWDEREAKKNTFTKSIMSIVVLLYFIGALIGTALVLLSAIMNIKQNMPIDPSMFIAYAAYIGGPTATAIGFYAWKSKAENLLKIGRSVDVEKSVETIDVISRIGGV